MINFLNDMILYLDNKFESESSLEVTPKGYLAYSYNIDPDGFTPYYVIQLLDNSTNSEDFSREVTTLSPIQITTYGVNMKIDGSLTSAQMVSLVLAEKVQEFMEQYKYTTNNITSMRRTTVTPALPYEDGSKAYYSVIRYNIILKTPYVSA